MLNELWKPNLQHLLENKSYLHEELSESNNGIHQNTPFKDCSFNNLLYLSLAVKFPAILTSDSSTLFQFTGSPMSANWVKGNDISAYNLANKVSASVDGFYTPAPGSLVNTYSNLIFSMKKNTVTDKAKQNLKNIKYQSNYEKADGASVSLPTITINGDLGKDLDNWKKYSDNEYDLDISLAMNQEAVINPSKNKNVSKLTTCVLSFISTDDSNVHFQKQKEVDNGYILRVKIKGIRAYSITFGDWYSPSLASYNSMYLLAEPEHSSKRFFAKTDGSFHMIPSLIWVIYRPTIDLTINEQLQNGLDHHIGENPISPQAKQVKSQHRKINTDSPIMQDPIIFGVTSIKNYIL